MNHDLYNGWRESEKKKYSTKNPFKKRAIQNFLNKITELTPKHVGILVDVGCGEGVVINYIKQNVDANQIIGLDLSLEALKTAKRWNKNAQFIRASAYFLPLKNKSINSSLCLEVLEHLEEPEKATSELERVTQDSFIISVPNSTLFRLANIASLKNLRRLGEDHDHVQRFTEESFLKFLKRTIPESDFSIEKSFPWLIGIIKNLS